MVNSFTESAKICRVPLIGQENIKRLYPVTNLRYVIESHIFRILSQRGNAVFRILPLRQRLCSSTRAVTRGEKRSSEI
jgi:hypothetical protein